MSPVDYHGWTHAPKAQGGTDPIPGLEAAIKPVFVARQSAAFTTLVSGNYTGLLWDEWDTTFDTSVFDVNLSAGDVTTVDLLLPGAYVFTCTVVFATNFTATAVISLAGQYDFNNEQTFVGVAGGFESITYCAALLIPAPFEAGPALPPPWGTMQWQVRQDSGTNKATDFGTFMQIRYDGLTDHAPES